VVLFQAGCDVIVISSPGGAARNLLIADSERATPITCSVKDSLGSLWQQGNFNTSQVGWNPPARGRSTHNNNNNNNNNNTQFVTHHMSS